VIEQARIEQRVREPLIFAEDLVAAVEPFALEGDLVSAELVGDPVAGLPGTYEEIWAGGRGCGRGRTKIAKS